MQRTLAHALLVAGLALAAPAGAQLSAAPTPAVQAESHVLSAFTSRADPRVLSDTVILGPALREQFVTETDSKRIYDALVAGVAGKPLRSRTLPISEAAPHATLGLNLAEPIVLLEAGDVRLLLQYSMAQKNVAFVEQLAGITLAAPAPPPKPEPIVEKALPTEPPPPPPPPPAAKPVAAPPTPKPAPLAKPVAPKVVAPVAATPAAPKTAAAPARPRGECVVKPVMSDDDLWNCSAPGLASDPVLGAPAPVSAPIRAPAAAAPTPQPAAQTECVIKPVMSEDDLRACGARR